MKKQGAKSSIFIRMALVLFVFATILTTIVSNMYAKFVSEIDNDSPTASATAWGFNINFDGSNMFSQHYQGGVKAEAGLKNEDYAVRAQAEGTVVTPDTSGEMVLTITGSAEVKAKITMSADGEDVSVKYSGVNYVPIKWSLTVYDNGVENKIFSKKSFAEMITYLNSFEYTVNASAEADLRFVISWEWPYENGADDAEKALYNELDSVIAAYSQGKTIDLKYNVNTKLDFSFGVIMEQVD